MSDGGYDDFRGDQEYRWSTQFLPPPPPPESRIRLALRYFGWRLILLWLCYALALWSAPILFVKYVLLG